MHARVEAGADVIELGVPFSDPMADGPVIQRAADRAIAQGVGLSRVLAMVAEFRQRDADTPVVLMGYANPIERMGQDRFALDAAQAGVDGVLVVDYPPEEVVRFAREAGRAGHCPHFPAAPTSTEARIKAVAVVARGYVYYVSLKGVTGSGSLNTDDVAERVAVIRRHVRDIPVGVGFGIRDAESAQRVARAADAVVIGSKLIETMEQAVADVPAAQNRCCSRRRQRLAAHHPAGAGSSETRKRVGLNGGRDLIRDEKTMSWIEKLLPPRINKTSDSGARRVPEGLWVKCPSCESVLYSEDLAANLHVCPTCDHHMRIGARARIDSLLDMEGRVEIGQTTRSVDTLKFKDTRKYPERLQEAVKQTGETDAGGAAASERLIRGVPATLACFEFEFMGGSMGSVVGERFARGAQAALDNKTPFICVAASGGARMQEGLLVATDGQDATPCPRVIEQTVREKLPEGFHVVCVRHKPSRVARILLCCDLGAEINGVIPMQSTKKKMLTRLVGAGPGGNRDVRERAIVRRHPRRRKHALRHWRPLSAPDARTTKPPPSGRTSSAETGAAWT